MFVKITFLTLWSCSVPSGHTTFWNTQRSVKYTATAHCFWTCLDAWIICKEHHCVCNVGCRCDRQATCHRNAFPICVFHLALWIWQCINPLALELNIYSLAHHLCTVWIFYEPRNVALGNTRHFVEEYTKRVRESKRKKITYICWLNI